MERQFGYGIGYELEVYGIQLEKVQELLTGSILNKKKTSDFLDYTKYNIMQEIEITDIFQRGGEIISPILYSEEELKKSISKVLDIVSITGGYDRNKSNSGASLHFHFGIEVLENNKKYYIRLIKLLKAYEGEIFNHSRAENDDLRKIICTFSRPYPQQKFNDIIQYLKDNNPKYNNIPACLSSKKYMFRLGKNSFEFRTCNNPLVDNDSIKKESLFNYEKSYQQFLTYFNMWKRLLEYIKSPEYDDDRIDYYCQLVRDNQYVSIPEREKEFIKILKK